MTLRRVLDPGLSTARMLAELASLMQALQHANPDDRAGMLDSTALRLVRSVCPGVLPGLLASHVPSSKDTPDAWARLGFALGVLDRISGDLRQSPPGRPSPAQAWCWAQGYTTGRVGPCIFDVPQPSRQKDQRK